RGGIRDIEFLVQCLQRVYGGAEPWLRSGGTLFSLQKLHDKGHITGHDFQELTSAYGFLRHLEHRLQLREGQQVHRLPRSEYELRILQRSMARLTPDHSLLDLRTAVQERMAAVAEIYQRVIFQKLAEDAPELYRAVNLANAAGRKNMLRFAGSAYSSSERYANVIKYQGAIAHSALLFELSDYLSDFLVRYPEEVSTLADIHSSVPQSPGIRLFELPAALFDEPVWGSRDPVFEYIASSSGTYGEKVALLRRHFRHLIF